MCSVTNGTKCHCTEYKKKCQNRIHVEEISCYNINFIENYVFQVASFVLQMIFIQCIY